MTDAWRWRSMAARDLAPVLRLADALFPDHPEAAAHFAERLGRGGDLCLALASDDGSIGGYVIAYPWPLGRIPPLNRPLGSPLDPGDAVYLNDLGVRPDLSGAGHARAGWAMLADRARRAGHVAIALVAVNGSEDFWRGRGFEAARATEALAAKLASYGAAARYMVRVL